MSASESLTGTIDPQKEQLIESAGNGIVMGYRLNEARENFCGSLIDPSVSPIDVYHYYKEFAERLEVALFDSESATYLGENVDSKMLADRLIGQIACVATMKSQEMTIDQVEDVVDLYTVHYPEFTWGEIAISSLNHIVLPYLEDKYPTLNLT